MKVVFSVLLILVPALVFGYLRAPMEMFLAIVAGSLAAAFLNIDRIKRVKGAGFEAEMRRAVEEAYATTAALRQLAKPLLATTLHILTTGNRWGGMDPQQKHAFRAELERLGQQLEIADDQAVRSAHELFFRYHIWDHFSVFADNVWQLQTIQEATRKKLMEMRSYKSSVYPSREDIEAILGDEADKLRPSDMDRLKDYVHYAEHHTLRRSEALSHE